MLPSGSIKWKDSQLDLEEPRTLWKLALRYRSSSSWWSSLPSITPATEQGMIKLRAWKSLFEGLRLTAYPTFLPLQYIVQRGVENRLLLEQDPVPEWVPPLLSSTILSVPPLISFANTLVGTASSRRRIGLVEFELAWMQKLSFPLRYPNMVPVMVAEEVVSDDGGYFSGLVFSSSCSTKVQLQVGISSSMRERRSLHDRTCFWQSTVVTPLVVILLLALPTLAM